MKLKRNKIAIVTGGLLAFALIAAPSAQAATNLSICSNKATSKLSLKSKCTSKETKISRLSQLVGKTGATGATGNQGNQGNQGATGGTGGTGTAATIAAGDVNIVPAASPAAVRNSGTSSAAIFDFDIPAGAAGLDAFDDWVNRLSTGDLDAIVGVDEDVLIGDVRVAALVAAYTLSLTGTAGVGMTQDSVGLACSVELTAGVPTAGGTSTAGLFNWVDIGTETGIFVMACDTNPSE